MKEENKTKKENNRNNRKKQGGESLGNRIKMLKPQAGNEHKYRRHRTGTVRLEDKNELLGFKKIPAPTTFQYEICKVVNKVFQKVEQK